MHACRKDTLYPLLALEEVFQVYRAIEDLVQLLDVGHALGFGEGEELGVQRLVRDEHFVRGELVVEWQGGAVLDAIGN